MMLFIQGQALILFGGPGVADTVVYPKPKSQYSFSHEITPTGDYLFLVTKNDETIDGLPTIDDLKEVERVQFDDFRCTIDENVCRSGIGSSGPVDIKGCFVCQQAK